MAIQLDAQGLMRCDAPVHKPTLHVTSYARAQLTKLKRGVVKGLGPPRRDVTARATDTQQSSETYTPPAVDALQLNEVFISKLYGTTPWST